MLGDIYVLLGFKHQVMGLLGRNFGGVFLCTPRVKLTMSSNNNGQSK